MATARSLSRDLVSVSLDSFNLKKLMFEFLLCRVSTFIAVEGTSDGNPGLPLGLGPNTESSLRPELSSCNFPGLFQMDLVFLILSPRCHAKHQPIVNHTHLHQAQFESHKPSQRKANLVETNYTVL
jgi:hypothetical protein